MYPSSTLGTVSMASCPNEENPTLESYPDCTLWIVWENDISDRLNACLWKHSFLTIIQASLKKPLTGTGAVIVQRNKEGYIFLVVGNRPQKRMTSNFHADANIEPDFERIIYDFLPRPHFEIDGFLPHLHTPPPPTPPQLNKKKKIPLEGHPCICL